MKTIVFRVALALVAWLYVTIAVTACWPSFGREEERRRLQAQQMVLEEQSTYLSRYARTLTELDPEVKEQRAALMVLKEMGDPQGNSGMAKGVGDWKFGLVAQVFIHRDEKDPGQNRAVVILGGYGESVRDILILKSDERGELRSAAIEAFDSDPGEEVVVRFAPQQGKANETAVIYRATMKGFEKK